MKCEDVSWQNETVKSQLTHLYIVYTVSSNTNTSNENDDGTKYMAQENTPILLQLNDFKNLTQRKQEAESVAPKDEYRLLVQKEHPQEKSQEADSYVRQISSSTQVTKVLAKKHRVLEYEHLKSNMEHALKKMPVSTDIKRGSLPLNGSMSCTYPIRFKTYVFMILLSPYLSDAMNIQPLTENDQSLSKIQTFVSLSTPYCNPSNLNMTCPFQGSDNMQLLIDRCEFKKMCSSGYTPLCVNNEKGMAFICAPVHLRCEKGHWWRVMKDEEDPSKIKVTVEKCPTGYFQETNSNCINACRSKHLDLTNIEEKYLIYSEGNHISPTIVYCNYKEGYYNRAGRLLLDYDRESKHEPYFCSGNAAKNSPCVEGQEPLPNATCVLPCNPHECRDDHDNFICKQTCRDQIGIGHSITVIDKPDLDTECDGDSWVCQNGICKQSFNKYVCQCNPGFVKDRETEKCIEPDVGSGTRPGQHKEYIIGLAFIPVVFILVGFFILYLLYRRNIWKPKCLTETPSNAYHETSSCETGEISSGTSSNDSPSVTRNKSSRNDQRITFDNTETVNITNNTYHYNETHPEQQIALHSYQKFRNPEDDTVPLAAEKATSTSGNIQKVTIETIGVTSEDETKPLLPYSETAGRIHFTECKKETDDTNSEAYIRQLHDLMKKCAAVMYKDNIIGTAFRIGPSYVITAFHVIKIIVKDLSGNFDFSLIDHENVTLNFNENVNNLHKYKIRLTYVFHDEQYDFAILDIKDVHLQTEFPKAFLLWRHNVSPSDKLKGTIIGFGHQVNSNEKQEETCQLNIKDFTQRLTDARVSLSQNEMAYKEDLRNQNKDERLVDLGYSGIESDEYIKVDTFMGQGLSGGPVVTNEGHSPKVVAMFVGEVPRFYHELSRNKQSTFKERHLFNICLKMSKIHEILVNKNPMLASKIFPKEK
ncbi:uncharacterized protein LOC132715423 isoform X2 [Ruditapes philippinarum]|uniref:uncharacterized protein LOC132715423 isoform X2 n=1 Tax=Ruditapes philippinarum TaxID=129788 RepID=UPI00295BDC77|nr:uncharacterized protein LOC132715423 isoform X2 [Ruditapes philippinarum]